MLRVVAVTEGIAGGYCAKLLGDAGAHVTLVERTPGASPLREWSASGKRPDGEDGALFRFLHAGHELASGDWEVRAAGADLIVTDVRGVVPEPGPGQVVVTITPFGVDGPWADRPATEFTLQAWCGSTGSRGRPDRPPVAAGGRIGLWVGGTYAAMAGLAAARVGNPDGEHVDVSLLECMTVTMIAYPFLFGSFTGWPESRAPARSIEIPSIEPTADGWVGLCTITAQQFQDFLVLIERPDLIDDAALANAMTRAKRMDEFLEIIAAWTTRHTTDEVIEQASLLRIPVVPIGNGENITGFEHFVERGVFVPSADGTFVQPRVPYRLHPLPDAPEPRRVDHRNGGSRATVREGGLPLAGIRVVDFTAFWAGPAATHAMAALGADVVKIESVQRPDLMRYTTVKPPSVDRWWEWGPVFHGANCGKRSVTLDLNRDEGRALARRLIEGADVVIENSTPRVLEGFGLDFDAVHALNPRAVMVRMPAFGLDGPWRDRTGFAQSVEQVSGMAWVTGYDDGPPRIPRGPCDPLAGMHAVFATMVALDRREATGEGMLAEATLAEVALNVAAEQVVEHSAYGVLLGRRGNDPMPGTRLQGVFRCGGDDDWVAIACETDEQLAALRALVGDDVDAWCASRPSADAAETLVTAGVPAGDVVRQERVAFNEQHRARGFFEELDHPVVGRHGFPSLPFVFRRGRPQRGWLRSPAPTLGQHNDEVLGGELGLGADELARLRADALAGERPVGL